MAKVGALKSRPMLIVTSEDAYARGDQAFAAALRRAGNSRVATLHLRYRPRLLRSARRSFGRSSQLACDPDFARSTALTSVAATESGGGGDSGDDGDGAFAQKQTP